MDGQIEIESIKRGSLFYYQDGMTIDNNYSEGKSLCPLILASPRAKTTVMKIPDYHRKKVS